MLFHCLLYSKLEWNIGGSCVVGTLPCANPREGPTTTTDPCRPPPSPLQMPPWFVLSGFVLAVVYKNKDFYATDNASIRCCFIPPGHLPVQQTDIKRFFRNRFARIAPSYYLVTVSNNVKTPHAPHRHSPTTASTPPRLTQAIAVPLVTVGYSWTMPELPLVVIAAWCAISGTSMWLPGLPAPPFCGPSWTVGGRGPCTM